MLYILWISADFCPEFKLDMSQGEVSFLAPKISLWRAKKDTSFWDIAICRFYKLHKKLRVKALSLSIFCHFDEVILNFWWAIEEKICSSYAAGMLFWKRRNYRFAKRYGFSLKKKNKLHKNCIQFFFFHQHFNRTSSEMHKKFRKNHGRNPKANKRWLYLGKFLYTLRSGTPCWTYPQESNIIFTSNSEFICSSFFSICTRHDQNKRLTWL